MVDELLNQTLSHGYLTNIKGWSPEVALQHLLYLVNTVSYRNNAHWDIYLVANYFRCLKQRGCDEKKIPPVLNIHLDEKGHILEQLGTALANYTGSDALKGIKLYDILCILYLSQVEDLSAELSAIKSLELQAKLYAILMTIVNQSNYHVWYRAAKSNVACMYQYDVISHNMAILGLNTKIADLHLAVLTDNSVLLSLVADSAFRDYRHLVFARMDYLATNAPLYWEQIRYSYGEHLMKCDPSFMEICKFASSIKDTNTVLGGLTPPELKELSETTWAIWSLSPVLKAYYLGFPIHQGLPSTKILKRAIFELARAGSKNYAIDVCTKHHLSTTVAHLTHQPETKTDFMEVPFDHYSPFDCITYIEGDHHYEFTRPSWSSILEKRQNPYNRSPLESMILAEIELRYKHALSMGLPPCRPLAVLIDNVIEDNLPLPTVTPILLRRDALMPIYAPQTPPPSRDAL